jgi:hypothetical protein
MLHGSVGGLWRSTMQLSNELFFALFSIVMVVAVVWFVRSASRFKAWTKSRDDQNEQR